MGFRSLKSKRRDLNPPFFDLGLATAQGWGSEMKLAILVQGGQSSGGGCADTAHGGSGTKWALGFRFQQDEEGDGNNWNDSSM
ncbi:hypothetical protein GOBAR_DD11741 [Gossypium barbadense]|nr:hypothetical protein GOBAR_DD11741 [Gossypium barbadense]